jgi:phosphoribosylanthranilate isomerase
MSLHIKICGFTEAATIAVAVQAGVDSIGLVLDSSPRQLSLDDAVALARHIPDTVKLVAVCGRPSLAALQEIQSRLSPDWIQLMGDALPTIANKLPLLPAFEDGVDILERVKAFATGVGSALPLIVADGPKPGQGMLADWTRLAALKPYVRLIVAGGLKPGNVGAAIARLRPYGVDVSSGVEAAMGRKDPDKIRAFVAAVRQAEQDHGL